jgi:hypothetical protein
MASHKLLESYCDSVNELNNNQKNNRNYFQKFLNSWINTVLVLTKNSTKSMLYICYLFIYLII